MNRLRSLETSVSIWLLASACLLFGAALMAQEQRFERPELTVRVAPAKPYLQEQILHSVRLVSAYNFAELEVEIPAANGAETIIVMQPNVRPFRSYGVEGFIYETTRVLFPESSGTLRIPGVSIEGAIAVGNQTVQFKRETKPVEMQIAPVPSVYEGSWWLVSGLVEISEEYATPLDLIRVGDTVSRHITVTAKGSTGEHIPALEMRPSRGLTILPGTPERMTEKTSGGVTGILKQTFDITVVESQPVDFGPVRLVWWDSEADAGRRTAAKAIRIEPLPRDVIALKKKLMDRAYARLNASRVSLVVVGLLVFGLLLSALLVLSRRRLTTHDRTLLRASRRSPTAAEAMQALYTWTENTFADMEGVSVANISRRLGVDVAADIDSLSKKAFADGNNSNVDFQRLAYRVVRARQNLQNNKYVFERVLDRVFGPPVKLPRIG